MSFQSPSQPPASSAEPPSTPPPLSPEARLKHNVSLAMLVACPLLIALPPRKLDWYTFSLVFAGGYSARYLVLERRGGVWGRRDALREEGVSEEIRGVVWDVLSAGGRRGPGAEKVKEEEGRRK